MFNFEIALKSKNISDEVCYSVLGIHRNTWRKKKLGESEFSIDEAFKLKRNLLPEYDLEYLFKQNDNQ